jgi:hypothetical protein
MQLASLSGQSDLAAAVNRILNMLRFGKQPYGSLQTVIARAR